MTLSVSECHAQTVQTGHYAPGWNGLLKAGIMAPDPGFYMMNTSMFFNASKFRDGSGDITSETENDYILNALALVWRPDFQILGADYQAVAAPAFGNFSGRPVYVNGEPQDAPLGLTDIFVAPIVLGWHWDEFHLAAALSGFAPTGRYSYGDPDNTGLGFWTIMPFALATYRTERSIFENLPLLITVGVFYEIHSNQQGWDFRPGDSFTLEWSLGLEVTKRTDLGVTGYVYRQVNDPQGSDAEPVDKYRSNGLGLTFSQGVGPVKIHLRAYRDFNVRNGPEGTLIYLDIAWGWSRNN